MPTVIHQRVRDCRAGRYPAQVCRVASGWVVMGDVQFLPGYCVLMPDPVVASLNDLSGDERHTFLHEMSVIGDVLLELTPSHRINYEILCNIEPALHAHVFPRRMDEPEELRQRPVWFYDWAQQPAFDPQRDRPLMEKIAAALEARGVCR